MKHRVKSTTIYKREIKKQKMIHQIGAPKGQNKNKRGTIWRVNGRECFPRMHLKWKLYLRVHSKKERECEKAWQTQEKVAAKYQQNSRREKKKLIN